MNISIIGTGNMAKGIGTRLVSGGTRYRFTLETKPKAQN